MDNMHQPPGGDPQDSWPTEELGIAAGPAWYQAPGAGGGPGAPPPPGGGGQRGRSLRGRALWWGAGFAVLALLAGGVLAATSSAAAPPTGPTGQAATLNTELNSAASPASDVIPGQAASATSAAACLIRAAKLRAAGHPLAARAALWRCGHRLQRVRALGGIHGQFTFETRTGARTIAYERGLIQSVSGTGVVVRAKDGTTWTWVLEGSTVIREGGQRVSASALAAGETVFAGGPVVSGAYDARLIVIRAASSSPSPGSSPSPATGS